MQKDNSTLKDKLSLRLHALAAVEGEPVIIETHGGAGQLFKRAYHRVTRGAVFEKDEDKADILADQRPTWSVFNCKCEEPLAAGACDHLEVNFLDVDPYGSPFGVLKAFFGSQRPFAPAMQLVVNDGLRQNVQIGRAWGCKDLDDIVVQWGNDLYPRYLEVAQEKVRRLARLAGYEVTAWKGYYTGHARQMTHYWAQLRRPSAAA